MRQITAAIPESFYLFSPNLLKDWDNINSGYPSFRRFIENILAEHNRCNRSERLKKLDAIFGQYKEKETPAITPDNPWKKSWDITSLRDLLFRIIDTYEKAESIKNTAISDLK